MDNLKIALQYAMPKTTLSRLVGKFASAKAGALTHFAINRFIKAYGIDMSEAKLENAQDFATFNDFFTRELKDGLRPINPDSNEICFPVDGTISQQGDIVNDQIIQAKGFNYSLETLLGGDVKTAAPFQGGKFSTIYLAPKDYHRIHMPMKGTLREMIFVPGELFSVNPLTAANVPNLFARNERVVTIFDTAIGPMALVLVGATIVASMETVWAGTIAPNGGKSLQRWHYPAEGEAGAITLEKGAEMGRFKLGSTTVCCFPEGTMEFCREDGPGKVTRLGQPYGYLSEE
ncbi:archaetidylserine decarboxylase [Thalassotalea ponticola]|uniref:archaetidylserine decarboxylase n=1 Tax=Thalassotalea ponticola TaxID=1523392 RepID=UPI0025B59D76|nr:archaetidylserine decarboxylase [Thalassotalea ponticola]MDN3653007.1 archaetidylserine decarboxylase [Thalassotalea ponticola]